MYDYLFLLNGHTVSSHVVDIWCAVMGTPLTLVSDIDEADGLLLVGGTDADLYTAARAVAEVDKPLFWIGDDVVVRFDNPRSALETRLLDAGEYKRPWYAHSLHGIPLRYAMVFARDEEDGDAVTPVGLAAQQAGVRISDLPRHLLRGLWEAWQEEVGEMESDFIEWAAAEIRLAMKTRR